MTGDSQNGDQVRPVDQAVAALDVFVMEIVIYLSAMEHSLSAIYAMIENARSVLTTSPQTVMQSSVLTLLMPRKLQASAHAMVHMAVSTITTNVWHAIHSVKHVIILQFQISTHVQVVAQATMIYPQPQLATATV